MPTLSEYAKLSNDLLINGVFEHIVTESQLAEHLNFESFEGNALKYNRENALPTASTYSVGSTWEDTEPTYTAKSASLAIVGVQSPLDRYVLQTRSDQQSQEAVLYAGMAKSLARKIEDLVITGEPETVTTEFEGLDSLCRADTRMMAMDDGVVDGAGAAETELTIDRLDAMIDLVTGTPDALIMNKTMRRKLTSISRASGSGFLSTERNSFGRRVTYYNDTPIVIDDFITDAEQYNAASTWPSSTATTIYAARFGRENQGHSIIHNGAVMTPDIQNVGIKEKANENLYRMVVYIQAVLWSAKRVAALGGIDSAA